MHATLLCSVHMQAGKSDFKWRFPVLAAEARRRKRVETALGALSTAVLQNVGRGRRASLRFAAPPGSAFDRPRSLQRNPRLSTTAEIDTLPSEARRATSTTVPTLQFGDAMATESNASVPVLPSRDVVKASAGSDAVPPASPGAISVALETVLVTGLMTSVAKSIGRRKRSFIQYLRTSPVGAIASLCGAGFFIFGLFYVILFGLARSGSEVCSDARGLHSACFIGLHAVRVWIRASFIISCALVFFPPPGALFRLRMAYFPGHRRRHHVAAPRGRRCRLLRCHLAGAAIPLAGMACAPRFASARCACDECCRGLLVSLILAPWDLLLQLDVLTGSGAATLSARFEHDLHIEGRAACSPLTLDAAFVVHDIGNVASVLLHRRLAKRRAQRTHGVSLISDVTSRRKERAALIVQLYR